MNNLKREGPIVLSGRNIIRLGSVPFVGTPNVPATVSINLKDMSDRSRRWILIDSIGVSVDPRSFISNELIPTTFPDSMNDAFASTLDIKLYTHLVSLTDEFVPLMTFGPRLNGFAEVDAFSDLNDTGNIVFTNPHPMNYLEWPLPRPFLLRPGEALAADIRKNFISAFFTSQYPDLGADPGGAVIDIVAKGSVVDVDETKFSKRAVPYMAGVQFGLQDGTVAPFRKEGRLENLTKQVLHASRLYGRAITQNTTSGVTVAADPTFVTFGAPNVNIIDSSNYKVIEGVPFPMVFPPEIGATRFETALKPREYLKVQIVSADTNAFTALDQYIVALAGYRMENV